MDAHRVACTVEHRGLDEKSGLSVAFATADRARTFLLTGTQKPSDTIELGLRDQRSHLTLRAQAGAQAYRARGIADAVQYAIVAFLLYEQTRACAATLAVIEENRIRRARNRHIEIRIVEHDVGRLAAQLERNFLQIIGRGFDDQLADFGRSGERDLVPFTVRRQREVG